MVTQKRLIAFKLEKELVMEEYKAEKGQGVSCGNLVVAGGKVAGVAGQDSGKVLYWEHANTAPQELINYKTKIIAIKELSYYTLIGTAGRKLYIWEIPSACVQSIDLSSVDLKLISMNPLMLDTHANEILIATEKDIIRILIEEDRVQSSERLNKIISLPGKRQNSMIAISSGQHKALAVASDNGAIVSIDVNTNEVSSVVRMVEVVTCMDFNASEKAEYLLVIGTVKGNVFIALNDDGNCLLLESLKSKVIDIKIAPSNLCIVALLEDHNCVLFEATQTSFEKTCQRKSLLHNP